MSTNGEDLLKKYLDKLPSHHYFTIQEPTIVADNSYKNPDFVVVSVDRGVFVIEVKDWVKILTASSGGVVVERRDGSQDHHQNPYRIAEKYAQNLSKRFEKREELMGYYKGQRRLRFPYMSVVAFPNLPSRVVDQLTDLTERNHMWSKDDLENCKPEELLARVPSPWSKPMEKPLTKDMLDIMRGVIDPHIIIRNDEGSDIGTLTVPQEKLVREEVPSFSANALLQMDLLEQEVVKTAENLQIRLVRGVAGSGKSLVLRNRAQYLAQQYDNKKILILAFNKPLAENLRVELAAYNNIDVLNFHAFCSKLIKLAGDHWPQEILKTPDWLEQYDSAIEALGLTEAYLAEEFEWIKEIGIANREAYLNAPRDGRRKSLTSSKREQVYDLFEQYEGHKHLARQLDWSDIPLWTEKTIAKKKLSPQYHAILIDEAQDFAPSWFSIIQKVLHPDGLLFICDDPTQSLWRTFSWKQRGIEVRGKTRVLRVPFRCTQQITEAAHALLGADSLLQYGDEILEPDLQSYALRQGVKPLLKRFKSLEDEIQHIKYSIGAYSGDLKKVSILCHSKRIVKYWAELRNSGVHVSTFNDMKGLEFSRVYVPHLHNSFDVAHSTGDPDEATETRRRIFTAMTRARDELIMSYQQRLPIELEPLLAYVDDERMR